MSLEKDLAGLAAAYASMNEGTSYTLTNADRKGNTPAWQNRNKKNVKTGEPLYKMADHMKEDYESELWDKVANLLTELHEINEEGVQWKVVPLHELKKKTLGSYIKKASKDLSDRRFDQGDSEKRKYEPDEADDKEENKLRKREKGISRAAGKLTKEGHLHELKKSTLGSYVKKASKDLANRSFDHGESEKRQYEPDAADEKERKKQIARQKGIDRAADKLTKEDKDTPDQVKAVIAYDKARKGTRDATYDTEHGKTKQAKKERDYAKWQRDRGAEDAQKSGHPWEHAKGSTREKEGKKSEKHAHIKDSYDPSDMIQNLVKSGMFSPEELERIYEVI